MLFNASFDPAGYRIPLRFVVNWLLSSNNVRFGVYIGWLAGNIDVVSFDAGAGNCRSRPGYGWVAPPGRPRRAADVRLFGDNHLVDVNCLHRRGGA